LRSVSLVAGEREAAECIQTKHSTPSSAEMRRT
jgi:hypothetical protein